MTTYHTISWTQRIAFVAVTVVIGVGALEIVAGSMTSPDPAAMAQRQQVIAAQAERAFQLREMQRGEVRVATTTKAAGL
jgi:hypothetical protein